MFESLAIFPLSFWLVIVVLLGGAVWCFTQLDTGLGIPSMVFLATAGTWYVGDALYNDYENTHVKMFSPEILSAAWLQVASFMMSFLVLTPVIHRQMNVRFLGKKSGVLEMVKKGVNQPSFQAQLNQLFYGCASLWLCIVVIAWIRLGDQIPYFFFPFLGYKAEPWGRGRIGTGFDALLSLTFYFQMLVTSIFGVVAALAEERKVMNLARICCVFSWPYFIFDRTRNTMLGAMVPGIVCFALLRVRGSIFKKAAVLLFFFMILNAWMGFVIANRSSMSITAALSEKGFKMGENGKVHHEGLNMYEELCWLNFFIDNGSFKPNWGTRYFAEAVNIVPRALWPGKPLIGIDYAIARGHGDDNFAGSLGGGVNATISTGFIGQGVNNFGTFLGPPFAAMLMSFWVCLLARLDLNIHELGNLPLYGSGLILTFNLGRDITLITLYPFIFGSVAIGWLKRHRSTIPSPSKSVAPGDRTRSIPEDFPKAIKTKFGFSLIRSKPIFKKRSASAYFTNRKHSALVVKTTKRSQA